MSDTYRYYAFKSNVRPFVHCDMAVAPQETALPKDVRARVVIVKKSKHRPIPSGSFKRLRKRCQEYLKSPHASLDPRCLETLRKFNADVVSNRTFTNGLKDKGNLDVLFRLLGKRLRQEVAPTAKQSQESYFEALNVCLREFGYLVQASINNGAQKLSSSSLSLTTSYYDYLSLDEIRHHLPSLGKVLGLSEEETTKLINDATLEVRQPSQNHPQFNIATE
jgi:hypothetical protein